MNAEGFLASTVDVVAVHGAVAVEEQPALAEHNLAQAVAGLHQAGDERRRLKVEPPRPVSVARGGQRNVAAPQGVVAGSQIAHADSEAWRIPVGPRWQDRRADLKSRTAPGRSDERSRRRRAERFQQRAGGVPVAGFVQVHAVDRQGRRLAGKRGRDSVEDVEEGHAVLRRNRFGRRCVHPQLSVATFDRRRVETATVREGLLGYRRDEGHPRWLGAVVDLLRDMPQQPSEIVPERRQALVPGERLVRAVEQEDDVRSLRLKVTVDGAEVQRPRAQRRLVR